MAASSGRNQASFPTQWDVFLSFRGTDTRDSFTDYLYHSLKRTGIRTYKDDPELRSGEVISDALLRAIQESKTYVVVFSENYASSAWCLDELVEILDCYRSMERSIIPVFYFIEASVVKYQTGSFDEAFQKHETHDTRYERGRLDKWRHALEQVGSFSGHPVRKNMSQTEVIDKVVDRVLLEINPSSLKVAIYPVGLDSRVEKIATLLSDVTEGVIRVGIYGMGGVGKTTLAKAVYNQNYSRFQGSCFLPNVGETSKTKAGLISLQQKLIDDVLKCKNITIDNADQGIEFIRARICSVKVLIVIDDLDNRVPLEFLQGPFALGSRIIITTRNEDLLDSIQVEARYKATVLGDAESRQLFCQHAFGGDNKMSNTFSNLSSEILKCAGGLPLALKVCGSALLNKSEEGWRCFINKLRRISISDVEEILLISFNALDDPMLKDIFLDIACFFIEHNKGKVVEIMETCYTFVNHNIDILKKRSLLDINDKGTLGMHDLLRDMGRKLVCNNSHEFGKHSRLWESEHIHKVLEENKGTEAIEGIIPSNFRLRGRNTRTQYAAETFKSMSKLRFLYLNNVKLTGSFRNTFKELRWLCWRACPLKCLPSEFYPEKLVVLALPGSNLRTMWELNMVDTVYEKLKTLDMSFSPYLTTTDFTRLPCLETLNLAGCKSLEEVHISIGSLKRLVSLNFQNCKNLKSLPGSIFNLRALKSLNIGGCSKLEAISANMGKIESLEELNAELPTLGKSVNSISRTGELIGLNLSFCRNLKTLPDTICNLRSPIFIDISHQLEALPIELGNLESLVELEAECLTISRLPDSIGRLSKLVKLNLASCKNLKNLPDTICNLRSLTILDIGWCTNLEALPVDLGNLESLEELNAQCLNVSKLPDSIGRLSKLVKLNLLYCEKLKTLPGTICNLISLKILDISWCSSLEVMPLELGNLESLEELEAERLTVSKLPSSIRHLSKLVKLNLSSCKNLETLSDTIRNLR